MALFLVPAIITVLIAVVTYLIYSTKLLKIIFTKPNKPLGAVEIDKKERIFAHPDFTDKLQDLSSLETKTTYDVVMRGLKLSGDLPLFSYRYSSTEKFKSYTYKEAVQICKEMGSGLVSLGNEASNKTFIGIYGAASVDYALPLYTSWLYSMVPVGIYDSLGRDGVQFIIRQSEVKVILADDLKRVRNLIEWKDDSSAFNTIVTFVKPTVDLVEAAEAKKLQLITNDELRERGRANLVDFVPPKPSDTVVLVYTSGSTGEPKGCMVTHESIVCAMFGCARAFDLDGLATYGVPRALNYLPMAHMFGLGTIMCTTYLGGEIGFWQGKVDKLTDDFRDFRPTFVCMVPRLLNRLYDAVRGEALKKGLLGRILFRLAVKGKMALLRRRDFSRNTLWDKLLFNKVRERFGNNVQRVISSSAPLSAEVSEFARSVFSCFLVEAYGQTECVIGCWQSVYDVAAGETGIPTSFNHVKLVDVPEKDYYAKDRVGEICIRSNSVFSGYLKDEEKTRETIDADGWLHTGDIGQWTPHNTMKIIDRKKNMYKLSQGEYIAPEKIEDAYTRSPFIAQTFVYGDSYQSFPVAIVVLDDAYIKKWSEKEGNQALLNDEQKFKEFLLSEMFREGKKRDLMSYEQVKVIEIIKEPFTIENGLLTPTFKSRRFAVEKKYKELLLSLYDRLKG